MKMLVTIEELRRLTGLARETIQGILDRAAIDPVHKGKRVAYYGLEELRQKMPRIFGKSGQD